MFRCGTFDCSFKVYCFIVALKKPNIATHSMQFQLLKAIELAGSCSFKYDVQNLLFPYSQPQFVSLFFSFKTTVRLHAALFKAHFTCFFVYDPE
jgi:hypothetical protein